MTDYPIYPPPRKTEIEAREAPVEFPRSFVCSESMVETTKAFLAAAGLDCSVSVGEGLQRYVLQSTESMQPPEEEVPPLGYVLRISRAGIALRAEDEPGYYAGLQALWQLLECKDPVPCGAIVDAPALRVRSFQIDLGRQPETLAELKRLIRQQARYRYNECQLYLENSVKLPAFRDAADPEGLTCEEYRELDAFGAALGVDIVPSLNLLGHMEKVLRHPDFKHLAEIQDRSRHPYQRFGGDICPELPESRQFVAGLIQQMAEISSSQKLTVGLDECWTLGSHPRCRERLDEEGGAGAIFRDWICFLHEEAARAGKQMWMWEDMLFYHQGSLDGIPRDIGMNVWHYQHIEEIPMYSFQNWGRIDSLGTFAPLGHPAMLCTGAQPDHLHSMIRYAQGHPLDGVLVVQWEGSGIVQECCHTDRAVAAGVLWTGDLPDYALAARAVTGCTPEEAEGIGDLLSRERCRPRHKGGGDNTCPRFWSWPENAVARQEAEAILRGYGRTSVEHEALEISRAFLAINAVAMKTDYARETAALVGRAMLQKGLKESPFIDQALKALEEATVLARSLADKGDEFHRRYCQGLSERPMVDSFRTAPDAPQGLQEKLKRFAADPSVDTWPFECYSLHLDAIVIDPCAHHIELSVSDDGGAFESVYTGGFRASSAEVGNTSIMSFPVQGPPRFVKFEVGGFASIAFTRIRLETLDGTRLPMRVVEAEGEVRDPEHLLEFDNKIAVFNQSDVMSNWLSLTPLPKNFVILEFGEGQQRK